MILLEKVFPSDTSRSMTKHWQISLLKNDRRIRLFATTTDAMIEVDLAAEDASLIRDARQYHRRGQTGAQDHRDLAIGAFMAYASQLPYDLSFEHIESSAVVPEHLPGSYVGGPRDSGLVPVWEEIETAEEE
jgi:hypothetical protein